MAVPKSKARWLKTATLVAKRWAVKWLTRISLGLSLWFVVTLLSSDGEESLTSYNQALSEKLLQKAVNQSRQGPHARRRAGKLILIDEPYVDLTRTRLEIARFTSQSACLPLNPEQVALTLTTQLTLDRMWIMEHHCDHWPAPISISVYLPPKSDKDERFVLDELEVTLGCDMSRMTVTVLKGNPNMIGYPINALRNAALQLVETSHAVYIDSDFLVSKELHENLLMAARSLSKQPMAAIVVPAFEYLAKCAFTTQSEALDCLAMEWNTSVPKYQAELLPYLEAPKSSQRPKVKVGFQGGAGRNKYHGSTMYETWKIQNDPVPIPCLKSQTYEPYLAVRVCRDLPKFPEEFRGWGWNKIIWVWLLLRKLGYSIWQVPHGFVMHLPHPTTKERETAENQNNKDTDGSDRPEGMDRYLKWFWNNLTDSTNGLPPCTEWKEKTGKTKQTARGYE